MFELFGADSFDDAARSRLDADGHVVLPGLLTEDARTQLTHALAGIQALLPGDEEHRPNHYSAEYDVLLASLIRHPQLLALARRVLGKDIRFDHCVALNRPGGNDGRGWHSHAYAEGDPHLGFLRIFFYVNGFVLGDGNLKVVPGSHLFRDADIRAATDVDLQQGWMQNRVHPLTGAALRIEPLAAPPGSVALMWTHAAHGVNPRRAGSATRWSVVYAYRNPGAESHARWITPGFERSMAGTDGLMSLY
ncbi:MAG: hypothetical protein O2782_02680 [bacterium]|nr:hypothetical protein [bacterium]